MICSRMKGCCLLIFFITNFCITCKGQVDTIPPHRLSANVAYGILFKEAGLYYNYQFKARRVCEFSYGHRFHNLTIIENGGREVTIFYGNKQQTSYDSASKPLTKHQTNSKTHSPTPTTALVSGMNILQNSPWPMGQTARVKHREMSCQLIRMWLI